MDDLDDVLQEEEVQRNLSKELFDLLREIKDEEDVMSERRYSFNSINVPAGSFRVIEPETMAILIPKLTDLRDLVKSNEKDGARALANEIAQIVKTG